MSLRLRCGSCCLQGNWRPNDEDRVAVVRWCDAVVCVVADGMGGQELGGQAAEAAIATLLANLDKAGRDAAAGVERALRDAFTRANQVVLATHAPGQRGGGSTATLLLWLRGAERVHVAHVGDTRAYRLTAGRFTLMTQDHDVRTALVRTGTLTPEQARTYSIRNVLYRYLGSAETIELEAADLVTVPVRPGDRFLLCCDGTYNLVDDGGLAAILGEDGPPRRRAEALCQRALDAGSRDNVSAVVIDFDD